MLVSNSKNQPEVQNSRWRPRTKFSNFSLLSLKYIFQIVMVDPSDHILKTSTPHEGRVPKPSMSKY